LWLDGSADYLYWTPATGSASTKYTLSIWFKRGPFSEQYLFMQGSDASNLDVLEFTSDSKLQFRWYPNTVAADLITTQLFRDPTAWQHLVVSVDTTLGAAGERIKIYVNGARVTAFGTQSNPSSSATSMIGGTSQMTIGRKTPGTTWYYPGYLAEYIFLDGVAGTATDFGGWDANGNWLPVDPSGLTFGTNGFHLDFSDASNLGKDANTTATAQDSASGLWAGTTGSTTFSGNNVDKTDASTAIYAAEGLTGDFKITCVQVDTATKFRFGVYLASEQGTFNASDADGGLKSMTSSCLIDGGNNNYYTGSTNRGGTPDSDFSNGTTMIIERRGSTIVARTDTAVKHTFAVGWSGTTNIMIGNVSNFSGMSWIDESGGNNLGNDFDTYSITSAQQNTDSPTNTSGDNEGNYITFSPIDKNSNITVAGGNLTVTNTGSASFQGAIATQKIPNSGKYYFEVTLPGTLSNQYIGVVNEANKWDFVTAVDGSTSAGFYGFYPVTSTSSKVDNGSTSSYGGSIGNGSVLGFAIDKDNDEMYVSDDGTFLASSNPVTRASPMLSSLPDDLYVAMTAHNSGGHSLIFNFGQTAFAGSIPSGYVRLNTSQLAAPTVTDPRAYWSNSLYYGTAQNHSVRQCFDSTGTAWTPDFVWIKNRTGVVASHHIYDVVRGVNKFIKPNTTDAEDSSRSDMLTSFDSGGFSLGVDASEEAINKNNDSYVAWCMKAGGAASSNSNGSITSSVSAASHGGFSIGTFTAGSTGGVTIGHGLSRVPAMIIVKDLSATGQWWTYHEAMGEGKYLALQATTDEQSSTAVWNNTAPTTTVFSTQDNGGWLTAGDSHVFYAFAKTPGLIGIGSYTGNNSTDGPMVTIDDGASGFRPAFLIIKEYSGSNNGSWFMRDSARNPYNPTDLDLYVNSTAIEYTDSNSDIEFTANGFKIRANAGGYNESGAKNLYIAFADQPFNLARAR